MINKLMHKTSTKITKDTTQIRRPIQNCNTTITTSDRNHQQQNQVTLRSPSLSFSSSSTSITSIHDSNDNAANEREGLYNNKQQHHYGASSSSRGAPSSLVQATSPTTTLTLASFEHSKTFHGRLVARVIPSRTVIMIATSLRRRLIPPLSYYHLNPGRKNILLYLQMKSVRQPINDQKK